MRFFTSVVVAVVALCVESANSAPSGLLNDTGQQQCYDGTATMAACTAGNTGDGATHPRQDGRFGRDAQPGLPKTGAGPAGFDFTPLDNSGALAEVGSHVCVRDNHTQLIWSTETVANVDWNDAGSQAALYSRCGFSSGWRLPTRRELLSIVNRGIFNPAIDINYFPGTLYGSSDWYWSSDDYAVGSSSPPLSWTVYFGFGNTIANTKTVSVGQHARFVRSAP